MRTHPIAPPSKAELAAKAHRSAKFTILWLTLLTLPITAQVTVAVVPTSATPAIQQTRQFNATVRNATDNKILWQVNNVTGGSVLTGTITAAGLYTAPAAVPAPANVTVRAVSVADSTKSASSLVTITPPQVTVKLSRTSARVPPSASFQLTASVTHATNTAVTWQVNGVTGGTAEAGLISTAGVYTAPGVKPKPAMVIVTAISRQNSAATANAVITIGSGPAFYVSTTGNDTHLGTINSPWRTIQHAADTAVAGDTVCVMGGVYNEVVTLPRSGSATAGYITFQSYPGQTAIVDGTGRAIPGGQYGLFTVQDRSFVVISGFEIRNYTADTTANVPLGIYITGAGSSIQILGNRIHDIITTAKSANANALGMAVYASRAPASINKLTISGNEISNLTTGSSESLSVNGNVENWSVTNNIIHDNNNIGIDAIGFERTSPDPAFDQARNGLISGNVIYNITSYFNPAYGAQFAADGIYVDGGTGITIEHNAVHNVDIGLELACEHSGHVTGNCIARSNLIYHANSVGVTIGGYANGVGGTDNCAIVNNTLFCNDTRNTGSGEFQIQFHATNNVFENNIVSATSQGLLLNNYTSSAVQPAVLNNNLYFVSVGTGKGIWKSNGSNHVGFASFQTATGLDAHSLYANPLFLNTTTFDFHVNTGSPAINRGLNPGVPVVGTLDFDGKPRVQGTQIDMGAYEQP